MAGREEMSAGSSSLPRQAKAIAADRASVQIRMRGFEHLREGIVRSAELPHAHYRRKLRVLRLWYIALALWLWLLRVALWIARLAQILWRYLLGLAIFLALAWAIATYGPPAWSYVTGLVGETIGRFGSGVVQPPASGDPAGPPTGVSGNG